MGKKKWISNLYTYCVLVIASVFMVFPFLWLVLSSLKTEVQLFEVPIHILPDPSAELQRCNCGREYVYVYEEQSDYCSYYDGDYSCDQHPCGVCPGKDPISGRNRIFYGYSCNPYGSGSNPVAPAFSNFIQISSD